MLSGNRLIKTNIAVFLLFFIILIGAASSARASQLNGIWKSSSGKIVQIEQNNSGFAYKDLYTNIIVQANYFNYFGVPVFRSDLINGSFNLFKINSENEIVVVNSYSPDTKNIWTRQNNNGNSQNRNNASNQYNNSGLVQYTQQAPRQCSVCGGSGYSNSTIDAPNYTGGPVADELCSVCKRYRRPHTHMPCSSCGGSGSR